MGLVVVLYLIRGSQHHFLGTKRIGWRNTTSSQVQLILESNGERYDLSLCECSNNEINCFTVSSGDESTTLSIIEFDDRQCVYTEKGARRIVDYAFDDDSLFIDTGSGNQEFENVTHAVCSTHHSSGNNEILASMDGAIVDVLVSEGDAVEQGQTIVILEAMKMEHQLKAEVCGVVASISASKGDQVRTRQMLVEITADEGL
jgi:geranyl-CoA carboxylase alpha subunit